MQKVCGRFMRFGVLAMAVFGASLGAAFAAGEAPQLLARARPATDTHATAAKASPLSDRQACVIAKASLPIAYYLDGSYKMKDIQMHFVKEGLLFDLPKNKHLTLAYDSMAKIDFNAGRRDRDYPSLTLVMRDKKKHSFIFEPTAFKNRQQSLTALQTAMNTLMEDAHQGKAFVCSDDPADYANELTAFQKETAAWRALSTKPAISEEVYKDRLLAEDALKEKDLNAAVKLYEDGVAAGPTWDQGWYNAALVYAEMKDYFNAAICMKHYVVLVPDAPDVRTAKDNIILWEAKAAKK